AGVLAGLAGPQRRGLGGALMRAEPEGAPPEPVGGAAGLVGGVRPGGGGGARGGGGGWVSGGGGGAGGGGGGGGRGGVCGGGRLAGGEVGFVVARRSGRPWELGRAAGPAGVARLELGPLSFGAISGLLAARLARPLPRRVARQVFQASGGNPLFALE